jgi:cytochrome bd-type quinol oxidase subunit 2
VRYVSLVLNGIWVLAGGLFMFFWPSPASVAIGCSLAAWALFTIVLILKRGASREHRNQWARARRVMVAINYVGAGAGGLFLLGSLDLWIISGQELMASLLIGLPPLSSSLALRQIETAA